LVAVEGRLRAFDHLEAALAALYRVEELLLWTNEVLVGFGEG
jgi:hypothetical protein